MFKKKPEYSLQPQRFKYIGIFLYASIFWLVLGCLHFGSLYLEEIQSREIHQIPLQQIVLFLISYFCWAFVTTFVYYLIERIPPRKESWQWMPVFLAVMLIWVVFLTLLRDFLGNILWGKSPDSVISILRNTSPFLLVFNAIKFTMTYAVCVGIIYYLRAQSDRAELQAMTLVAAEAKEKRVSYHLQALQAQLSPHFLFNTLNAISGMARNKDHNGVVNIVAQLADLLRYALESIDHTEVFLENELLFTEKYIALQNIRFGNNFSFNVKNQPGTNDALCPPFCIQTLVENVFSHNEISSSSPITIEVTISHIEENLSICVENTFCPSTINMGAGIGLKNLRERLELLYGASAQLTIESGDQHYRVTLLLPLVRESND